VNDELRQLIQDKLSSEGFLEENWSSLVMAACDGQEAVETLLLEAETETKTSPQAATMNKTAAYITSLTVQGFRGIGPKQALRFSPGPGLTIVVGRNGSGKSSFAEALEVLFTGDSKRWSDRSKIWKEGWRNLHQPHPAAVEAELLLEGQGPVRVACAWAEQAGFDEQEGFVQPKGKAKTSLQALGWKDALVSYRPFLSYNELGSMLDEGPSKLYDALSLALGLEELVNAQAALAKSRLDRQRALDDADKERKELIDLLTAFLESEPDNRASACLAAFASKPWGFDTIAAALAGGPASQDPDISVLARAALLDAGDPRQAGVTVAALREAEQQLKAVAGTDAETSRQVAVLLEAALDFHSGHGDSDCPVCGAKAGLTESWAESSRKEVKRLRSIAAASYEAHRTASEAIRKARELLTVPPRLLAHLPPIEGLATAREQWESWHAGASINDLTALADHIETRYEAFSNAVAILRKSSETELKRREDRWRPISMRLLDWTRSTPDIVTAAEPIPRIKAAEVWLKDASAAIRNERFAPIADKAMAIWEHLRQQSNVVLGRIELTGAKSQRRVTLDVTVDGIPGAALGVMSQGELHSLALSLFLPRATLSSSPFRFVVIDDPVQSMDPSRVDGLAWALEETAQTRQVIVFTHDERLHEAVRRLGILTAGIWPRATALLARQALESSLDDLWKLRAPGLERCSLHAQLLCLPYFLTGNDKLAESVAYAWVGLSHAVHHHPYELPPTSAELLAWLTTVEQLVKRVKSACTLARETMQEL